MPRKTRAGESRTARSRAADARQMPETENRGPLHIPKHLVPRGMEVRWVREYITGQPDPNNLGARARKGWSPVPVGRDPALDAYLGIGGMKIPGEERSLPSVHRYGGLLLCERTARDADKARDQQAQVNREQLQAIGAGVEGLVAGQLQGAPFLNESSSVTHTHARQFKE